MNKQAFDETISQLLAEATAYIPEEELPDLPPLPVSASWYSFEMHLWAKGEEIRQFIQSAGRTLDQQQILTVLSICRNRNGKRGRQSFLMLLGRKAYAPYANAVAQLLPDPHLTSHAINTLYKMRSDEYTDQVAAYLDHTQALIRREAKRYLQTFQ